MARRDFYVYQRPVFLHQVGEIRYNICEETGAIVLFVADNGTAAIRRRNRPGNNKFEARENRRSGGRNDSAGFTLRHRTGRPLFSDIRPRNETDGVFLRFFFGFLPIRSRVRNWFSYFLFVRDPVHGAPTIRIDIDASEFEKCNQRRATVWRVRIAVA